MSNTADGTESHDPAVADGYRDLMRTGWAEPPTEADRLAVADWTGPRIAALADAFAGERLVVPAGEPKVRANDTYYRFRSDTNHTWLCGNQAPESVLVITEGEPVLYLRPGGRRDSDEFFSNRDHGELWTGRRPTLSQVSDALGIATRHLDELEADLAIDLPTRAAGDPELDRVASELRLIKDEWEVGELRSACAATVAGFNDCVAEWDRAREFGERWIEGTFWRRARTMGAEVGYDSIVGSGSHATTLHWVENSGPLRDGDLVLLDMGVEATTLYTADVTRTLPVNGRFTPLQRELYTAVLQAQQAGIEAVRPGADFRAPHRAAMAVLAQALADLKVLPGSVEEALEENNASYRRWTLHGTSHMLGMDVHDCAAASPQASVDGPLAEGMVLTVEPGLYFQPDDLLVPEELRGIGIRIEDDILVTADGAENLSAALPREPDEVEAWMGNTGAISLRSSAG